MKFNTLKISGLFAVSLLTFTACNNDDDNDDDVVIPVDAQNVVLTLNEGNFSAGNGSLSWYQPDSKDTINDIFMAANGQPLGDVPFSGTRFNDELYVVVNNSGRIEKLDTLSYEIISTLSGLVSPRYFLPVSDDKAFVSDLLAGYLLTVNPSNMSVTDTIALYGGNEEMVLVDNSVWVTNPDTNFITQINASTNLKGMSVEIEHDAQWIVSDRNNNAWILCAADWQGTHDAALFHVNTTTGAVVSRFDFQNGEYPSKLSINPSGDVVYWLNGGVYAMSINGSSLPSSPFISIANANLYGLDSDPNTGDIYVADAKDFASQGYTHRFSEAGAPIDTFGVGIIPSGFIFQ